MRYAVAPQATDPAIDIALDDHLIRVPGDNRGRNRLFIFLPSSRAFPWTAQLIQEEAALLGYHVIGLMYPNNPGLASFCPQSPDPDACYEDVRLQIITGSPQTGFVNVNHANSIDNRVAKLLAYLAAHHADEGWSRFLSKGVPRWRRIVVGGHSQGAGHAAMIAKLRLVDRVVMLSGVTDGIGAEAAPWVTTGATPVDRYFGLAHQRDLFTPTIVANWNALGLPALGGPAIPEASNPPYGGTHVLITDILPATGSYVAPAPHASTAVDFAVALAGDGTPLLRDAWRYLLGDCAGHAGKDRRTCPRSQPSDRGDR